jgi:hypothetical protein
LEIAQLMKNNLEEQSVGRVAEIFLKRFRPVKSRCRRWPRF